MKKNYSFKNLILFFSLCIAIIITLDFLLPGKTNTEIISSVKKNYEQYYNAGNNHHYSYRVSTKNRNFTISESFAKKVSKDEEISYKTSLIFNEVNSYYINIDDKSIHSLRIVSGLALPILVILIVLFSYYSNKNIDILLFVTLILLIVDLVFLII